MDEGPAREALESFAGGFPSAYRILNTLLCLAQWLSEGGPKCMCTSIMDVLVKHRFHAPLRPPETNPQEWAWSRLVSPLPWVPDTCREADLWDCQTWGVISDFSLLGETPFFLHSHPQCGPLGLAFLYFPPHADYLPPISLAYLAHDCGVQW